MDKKDNQRKSTPIPSEAQECLVDNKKYFNDNDDVQEATNRAPSLISEQSINSDDEGASCICNSLITGNHTAKTESVEDEQV